MNRLALVTVVCAAIGCNSTSKNKQKLTSQPSPIEAALVGSTWTGKLDQSNLQIAFSRAAGVTTGELRYTVFGAVRNRDKVTVSVDDKNVIHLSPSGDKNVMVGGKGSGISELHGQLSEDKATLSGSVSVRGGEAPWSVSTAAQLADIDPPLDVVAGEKALLTGKWEGKLGAKPAKLTVSKKAGRLFAKLAADRSASTFQVSLDATGHLTMTAQPRPTQQGLLTQSCKGYFLNRDLRRLRGTLETSVKQGFMEQSGEEGWALEDLRKPKK